MRELVMTTALLHVIPEACSRRTSSPAAAIHYIEQFLDACRMRDETLTKKAQDDFDSKGWM